MTPRLPRQAVFLTGQSDPRSCALSPAQEAFLAALPLPPDACVRHNFPYAATSPPHRDVPLVVASAHHAVLAVRSRRPSFARRHRAAVVRQLESADRSLVLAGSIGLDLLGRLGLPPGLLDRLDVFAYGAVVSSPPPCRTLHVVGRRDHLARLWPGRPHADHLVDGGHLDYLTDPQVAVLCRAFLADVSRTSTRP